MPHAEGGCTLCAHASKAVVNAMCQSLFCMPWWHACLSRHTLKPLESPYIEILDCGGICRAPLEPRVTHGPTLKQLYTVCHAKRTLFGAILHHTLFPMHRKRHTLLPVHGTIANGRKAACKMVPNKVRLA
eukprot:1143675-Pelagomonas_calceolata.AAC.2